MLVILLMLVLLLILLLRSTAITATTATTATTTTATPTATADPKTEIMLHCGLPKKVNNQTMNDKQTSEISALSPQLGLDWDCSCVEQLAQLILETL